MTIDALPSEEAVSDTPESRLNDLLREPGISQSEIIRSELIEDLERENAALRERVAELEAGNAVLRAERDNYSARLDASVKLIANILSALPPHEIKAPDGTIYEFNPPPEHAMKMLRAFKSGIDAAILEGK